jgi:hypothetical protein
MKKLVVLLVALFSLTVVGQKRTGGAISSTQADSTQVVKTSKLTKYVSVGLSISNGNTYDTNDNKYTFSEGSYPSIEFGVTRENVSAGLVIGRGNLYRLGEKTDKLGNYYGELKLSPSFPLGAINATLIFGVGSYFNEIKGSTFIEYGTGISYSKGNYSYGVSYSNWDGLDYITPSLSYSF